MGLDMNLLKKTYVKNWEHMRPEERHQVIVKKNGKTVKSIKPERISYIIEDMGYWRKANAIHKWFVDNVQEGNDDCKEYWVSSTQLETLLGLCNKVIASCELVEGKINNGYTFENGVKTPILTEGKFIKNSQVAHELLPTQEGFFFGGTDYDEYYLQDIIDTKKILEEALADGEGEYYYTSSW